MSEDKSPSSVSRRRFVQATSALSGVAVAAGLTARHGLAADSIDDSRLKTVLDRGKLLVGTGATNPPWHYEDENGQLIGMDIEMAKIVAGGLFGLSDADRATEKPRDYLEFVVQESNQRIPNLLTDKIDVNFQFMTVTTQRATQVEFTFPYYREAVCAMMLSDSEYNTLADIVGKGASVAILQNPNAVDIVKAGIPDAEVTQFPSVAGSVAALDAGRVDITAIDLSTGQYYTAQNPDKYKISPESWLPQTYSASVKPGDQIWLNFLNNAIHEAMIGVDFNLLKTAYKTYFNVDLTSPSAGFPTEFK
jgi:polar amino acid transport system substrate-binding protein